MAKAVVDLAVPESACAALPAVSSQHNTFESLVLPPDIARDPERLARFQREARAVAALEEHRGGLNGYENFLL
jgi:hypothetical protein